MTDVLSILFWVYTVCKGYPQTTSRKDLHCKQRMTNISGVEISIPTRSRTFTSSSLALIQEGLLSDTSLQTYGGPGSLSHDLKIWPITFQGSGPS